MDLYKLEMSKQQILKKKNTKEQNEMLSADGQAKRLLELQEKKKQKEREIEKTVAEAQQEKEKDSETRAIVKTLRSAAKSEFETSVCNVLDHYKGMFFFILKDRET